MPEIRHIVVLMMENHSFDNLLGMVPYQVSGRAGVDGFSRHRGTFLDFNRDAHGKKVFAQHAATPCQLPKVPTQAWNASHISSAPPAARGLLHPQ
jgi:phospholipase C